jgi:hypothetical protein
MKSFFLLFLFLPAILFAQPQTPKPDWTPYQFLIGEWVGEGGGMPGQGTGGFTFTLDLQNQILIRRNFADYPATKDKPASRHDDLMVIHQSGDAPAKADYWDNEGHVIHYTVTVATDTFLVFLSDSIPSAPRFRLSYRTVSGGKVRITFDIASPAKPDQFQEYIEAFAHRK